MLGPGIAFLELRKSLEGCKSAVQDRSSHSISLLSTFVIILTTNKQHLRLLGACVRECVYTASGRESVNGIKVWPLHGPIAGATAVTITGDILTAIRVTGVLFGNQTATLITSRFRLILLLSAYRTICQVVGLLLCPLQIAIDYGNTGKQVVSGTLFSEKYSKAHHIDSIQKLIVDRFLGMFIWFYNTL